jgi:Tfp pilus assembly protein PilF
MAQEALRLRRSGGIADGRALLEQAVAADPTHPNVALAQAVFETLDGQAGAIARGVERWGQIRGKHAHAQRMFYFCLRDRLREAGAHLDSAHCILTYLRDADAEAMPFVLNLFWPNIWKTLQTDLAAFGGAPGDDPGAEALAFVIRNLSSAQPAELIEHARAALAKDRNERYAAVLGMYLTRDKRGVMGPLEPQLQKWRTPLERVADQLLVAVEQQARQGQFDRAIRLIQQVFALVESDAHVRKTMRAFGMACLNSGQPNALKYFENVLNSWANAAGHPLRPDALRWRARVHERRKDLPKAWADADVALEAAGTRVPQVRFWRAFLAMRTGDHPRAIAECDAVVEAFPDNARAYMWRGLAGLHAGMGDAAAADLRTAIAKGEKDPLCHILAALSAMRAGDTESAMAHCEEAMAAEGAAAAEAWWLRGRLRLRADNERDAITDWADALTMSGSRWGRDVPLRALFQDTMQQVGRHGRALATRVLDEAEKTIAQGDLRTASNWLSSLRRLRGAVNAGRQAYVVAQFQCAGSGDPMQVFQLLEQSLDSGWKHPDLQSWGDERAFNRLRNAARFKELQARAKGK